jgi:CBS domain containing-hemolysin-like protein
MEVLSVMNQTGNSRMVVRENDRLIGIVSLKDMLGFLALKLELEGRHVRGPDLRKAA